jgi:hypothetical protein
MGLFPWPLTSLELQAQDAGTPTNFFVSSFLLVRIKIKLICRIIWCVKQMGNMQLNSNTTFFNSLLYLIYSSTNQLWVLGSCSSLVWIHVQSEPTSMHLQHLQRCSSVYDLGA